MGLMNYRHIQRICIYGFQMTHCNYFNDLLTLYVVELWLELWQSALLSSVVLFSN